MIDPIFDFQDGDFLFSTSNHTAIDSDGHFMMRMGNDMAMDLDSGELHFTSHWSTFDEDDD